MDREVEVKAQLSDVQPGPLCTAGFHMPCYRRFIDKTKKHTGIPGNENADQAVERGLHLDIIHTTVNASTFREQTRMKEQIEPNYNSNKIKNV